MPPCLPMWLCCWYVTTVLRSNLSTLLCSTVRGLVSIRRQPAAAVTLEMHGHLIAQAAPTTVGPAKRAAPNLTTRGLLAPVLVWRGAHNMVYRIPPLRYHPPNPITRVLYSVGGQRRPGGVRPAQIYMRRRELCSPQTTQRREFRGSHVSPKHAFGAAAADLQCT